MGSYRGLQRTSRILRLPNLRPTCAQLAPEEQTAIVNAFKDLDTVRASGLKLAGTKFFTVQANETSIYGKKGVRPPSRSMTGRARAYPL